MIEIYYTALYRCFFFLFDNGLPKRSYFYIYIRLIDDDYIFIQNVVNSQSPSSSDRYAIVFIMFSFLVWFCYSLYCGAIKYLNIVTCTIGKYYIDSKKACAAIGRYL